jgi:hypothetical protein
MVALACGAGSGFDSVVGASSRTGKAHEGVSTSGVISRGVAFCDSTTASDNDLVRKTVAIAAITAKSTVRCNFHPDCGFPLFSNPDTTRALCVPT